MSFIRVLICEHESERNHLRSLLGSSKEIKVVGLSSAGEEVSRQVDRLTPDVVILDVAWPGQRGPETIRRIKSSPASPNIMVYTACEEEETFFGALSAGASGYVLKKTPAHRLIESIQEVAQGGAVFSPCVARQLATYFQRSTQRYTYPLCKRELNILKLLVAGLPTKVIAGQVYLSEDGVKKNLKNIYSKLEVSCGKEAVAKAVREQIV